MDIALQDIDPARLKASHELLNVIAEKLKLIKQGFSYG